MSASELKFLVDVGVGKKVEEYLLEKRYDTKAVRSLDQRMPDQEIIRLAALEKRIVITMDKDFRELVYHYPNSNIQSPKQIKFQITRTKFQTNSKSQYPMTKTCFQI